MSLFIARLTRHLRPALVAVAIMIAAPTFAPAPATAQRGPESLADLAEKLLPSVVNISSTQVVRRNEQANRAPGERPQLPPGSPFEEFFRDFFDRQQRQGNGPESPARRATSLGSGFIVGSDGLIVTNNHVIEGAEEITVTLHDNTTLKAKIIGRDSRTDLAVLKVDSRKPLAAVAFGDSDKARIGDWVVAIGNPFGLGGTVTQGIISARARDIGAGQYDDFIQTDASINRGNSGGPLFNLRGEVIGVNTAIYSPTGGSVGIGFSIPAALAKPIVEQLKQHGKTRRGWLGVQIQTVTDELADGLGLDKARGALVARVLDGSPAQKAKIQQGDVILRFDGKDVPDNRRLPRMVADTPVDKTVDVTIWRQKREQSLKVTIAELAESDQEASAAGTPGRERTSPATSVAALGLQIQTLNTALREKFGIGEDVQGVVIVDVADNSPAAERGLRPGDVIVEVGQEAVKAPAEIQQKVDAAKKAGRKSILLLIDQKGDLRFIAVRLG